jgi:hypothetical protein
MMGARSRALLIVLIVGVVGVYLGLNALARDDAKVVQTAEPSRPRLLVLTSLPILFGEGFSLNANAPPVLKQLQQHYRLEPISVTAPDELAKGRILLMAQPRAQTPENLVALDRWVRSGGRLILLADPLLEWPSSEALGDVARPPPMFADTGLLAHWGLRLDLPDKRGPATRLLARHEIVTVSPGSLYGACSISSDRLVAHCRIGAGRVTIVGDADFLDTARLGFEARDNIDGLLGELATLEQT